MKKIIFIITIAVAYFSLGCGKNMSESQKQLEDCGPLDYMHSMFIINDDCWGQNPPKTAYLENLSLYQKISFKVEKMFYDEELSIYKYPEDKGTKIFRIFFTLIDFDAINASYSKTIDLGTSQELTLQFNQDSTEVSGKIKDMRIPGTKYPNPGFPQEIYIKEGTFRAWFKK